jgi:hypothetical protein
MADPALRKNQTLSRSIGLPALTPGTLFILATLPTRIGLPTTLRRSLARRLDPLRGHGCGGLNHRTRCLNPNRRHFADRWRGGHPDLRGGHRPWRWHFGLADDLRQFARRRNRTFDIWHFPTLLPVMRRHRRPYLTFFGSHFG